MMTPPTKMLAVAVVAVSASELGSYSSTVRVSVGCWELVMVTLLLSLPGSLRLLL